MFELTVFQIAWAVLWVLLLGTCGYALTRGGSPERAGAGLILVLALAGGLADLLVPGQTRLLARLIQDGLLAVGFLAIAVRYTSLWLGGAMLFQALQFSLQAYYFVGDRSHDALYAVVNNVNVVGVLGCLAAGTLATDRRRREQQASAPLPG